MESTQLAAAGATTDIKPAALIKAADKLPNATAVTQNKLALENGMPKAVKEAGKAPTQEEKRLRAGLEKNRKLSPTHPRADVVNKSRTARREYSDLMGRENAYNTLKATITNEAKYEAALKKDVKDRSPQDIVLVNEAASKGITIASIDAHKADLQAREATHTADDGVIKDKKSINAGEMEKEETDWELLEQTIVEQQKKLQQTFGEVIELKVGGGQVIRMTVGEALKSTGVNPNDWKLKQMALGKMTAMFEELGERRETSVRIVGRLAKEGGKWVDTAGKPEEVAKTYEEGELKERSKGGTLKLETEDVRVTKDRIQAKFKDAVDVVIANLDKAMQPDGFKLTDEQRKQFEGKLRARWGITEVKDGNGVVTDVKASANSPIRRLIMAEHFKEEATKQFDKDLVDLQSDQTMAEGTYWMGALKVEAEAMETGMTALVAQEGLMEGVDWVRDEAAKNNNWDKVKKIDDWMNNEGKAYRDAYKNSQKVWDWTRKHWNEIGPAVAKKLTKENIKKVGTILLAMILALLAGGVVISSAVVGSVTKAMGAG